MPSDAAVAPAAEERAPGMEDAGRRLHPLTLGFSALGIGRRMIWPALVGGFGVGGGEIARMLPIFIALLAVPALIGAALKYALYRWRLTGDELVLRSGVLNRQNRVIPLQRLQNVEVRQNVLHRVFGVGELRVETAAGAAAEAEAVLSVLAIAEAQAIRAELLARRGRRGLSASASVDGSAADASRPAAPPLAKLGMAEVLLAGATANEAGVIAAALAGAVQLVDDLPLPVFREVSERVVAQVQDALLLAGVIVLLLFLVLGWLISIAGAVVRYHGFTLAVDGGEMRKRYGLLTVHEASVPLERVQAIRVEESLPRRWLGLASLSIETAGGAPGQRGGAEAFVPIAPREDVGRLVRGIFAGADYDAVRLQPVHPAGRRRLERRYLLTFLAAWAPFWAARWLDVQPAGMLAPYLALLLPLTWMAAGWAYRGRGWAVPEGYVVARSGVLTRVTWIIPDRKLQTLHLRSTPFQRRLGLATLIVDTAAGGRQAAVIDLGAPAARRLLDQMAARVRGATAVWAAGAAAAPELDAAVGAAVVEPVEQIRDAEEVAVKAGDGAGEGNADEAVGGSGAGGSG